MHARALATLAAAAAAAFTALPSQAEPGSASFSALTSTTIAPGGTVNFEAVFAKAQDWFSVAWAMPEPQPAEGLQVWQVSGSNSTEETLSSLSLDVWSSSGEGQGVAMLISDAGPGTSYRTASTFSLGFSQPGSYSVTLQGSWQSFASLGDLSMSATRTCAPDGGQLQCTDWQYIGVGGTGLADTSGSFGPVTLSVQVVPEPATAALWLLGLLAVGSRLRHRAGRPVSPR
jgi:hypothetical protein